MYLFVVININIKVSHFGAHLVQEEIGYIDFLKANPGKWNNLKETVLAAPKEKQDELRRLSMAPNFWVSSITAVSEEGDFVRDSLHLPPLIWSRPFAILLALVSVVSLPPTRPSLSLVPTRLSPHMSTAPSAPTSSALALSLPVPARSTRFLALLSTTTVRPRSISQSVLTSLVAIRGSNPWGGQGHFVFIIVKGDSLGF